MKEQEGVIKYKLEHCNELIDKLISIEQINIWRTLLFKLKLIGQIKGRYDGYGFGNVSQRINSTNPQQTQFIISGTQTGHLESLSNEDFCTILESDPQKNQIKSVGKTKPSSESLTHASVYQHNKKVQSIFHVHSPEIWNKTHDLNLAYTSENTPYGTPKMADEVSRLLHSHKFSNTGIFSMLGHRDGIIAFSDCTEKTAWLLVTLYAKALSFNK